jgi:hypothetical protein
MYGYQDGFESTSAQAHAAAIEAGYIPYNPWASRMSPFYKQSYFWWPTHEEDTAQTATGLGAISKTLFYQFQTTVTRFVANRKEDYQNDPAGSLPTSGTAVNDVMFYDGEFDNQCKYSKDGKSTCTSGAAKFAGEDTKNYFVKTCFAKGTKKR